MGWKREKKEYKKGKGKKGKNSSQSKKSKKKKSQEDDSFESITGMFESKKGGTFTVFLKEEHLEILHSLEENDLLGVSQTSNDEIVSLWVKRGDEEEDED